MPQAYHTMPRLHLSRTEFKFVPTGTRKHRFCPLEWEGVVHGESLLGEMFSEKQNPDSRWFSQNDHGDWMERVLRRGFAPALDFPSPEGRAIWFSGYVQTYLERDLHELSRVASLSDFQRFMRIAAQRTARLLNQAEIARDAGLALSRELILGSC